MISRQQDKEHSFEYCHMENIFLLPESLQCPLGTQTLHSQQEQVVKWGREEYWLDPKMEPANDTKYLIIHIRIGAKLELKLK